MFETKLTEPHTLSLGLSLNHDRLSQDYRLVHTVDGPLTHLLEKETVTGAYGQYTFTPVSDVMTLMAGMRVDHSSLHDRSLSLTDIADMFGFSSPAHFSRYVQNNLGAKPSDLRE